MLEWTNTTGYLLHVAINYEEERSNGRSKWPLLFYRHQATT